MENVFILVMGAVMGSFLNVCIYRIPLNESILYPGSHCSNCKAKLKIKDLIPVFSWIFLRGKCRYCRKMIGKDPIIIETVTMILIYWLYYVFGLTAIFGEGILFVGFLFCIAMIDYFHGCILNRMLLPMACLGIFINLFLFGRACSDLLYGFILGGGSLMFLLFCTKGGMGGGDIKFAAVLGLWLGWQDILLVLFLAFLAGGVFSAIVLSFGIKERTDMVPFGPFLSSAAYISFLYGSQTIEFYREMIL
jgi:leader peptidase (prepilin peptidase) / N-methyltransferase